MGKAENQARFDLDLIFIPQYRKVLEELIEATDGFSRKGYVLVPIEVLDLAEAIEKADENAGFCVGFFCFFRHIMAMIDAGYQGKSGDIFTSRGLRLYFEEYCRLGIDFVG